jgi:hypothetical protein
VQGPYLSWPDVICAVLRPVTLQVLQPLPGIPQQYGRARPVASGASPQVSGCLDDLRQDAVPGHVPGRSYRERGRAVAEVGDVHWDPPPACFPGHSDLVDGMAFRGEVTDYAIDGPVLCVGEMAWP